MSAHLHGTSAAPVKSRSLTFEGEQRAKVRKGEKKDNSAGRISHLRTESGSW